MDTSALDEALKNMVLRGSEDEVLTYESHRVLDPARQLVMATAFTECDPKAKIVAIMAVNGQGKKKELIAVLQDTGASDLTPRLVVGSCQITYEDLSPSECIEYSFAEAPGEWAMAQLSLGALETYRGMKFEAWKSMLLNPTCEAQFRRMLHIGMVAHLYDPHVFPTPESLKPKYQVTDERTGKLIELPHPVNELRVWDVENQAYKAIDTQLTGAPSEAEKDAWWADFVKQLDSVHGHEYIAGLLAGK